MRFSCCGGRVNKISSKEFMRNKKGKRVKSKYQTHGNGPCLCKENSLDGKYHTSTTKKTPELSTFTYLVPDDDSNNNFPDEVFDDVTENVTAAYNEVVTDVAEVNDVEPNGSPEDVTDKSIDVASDDVTYTDIDEINDQVTESVTDKAIGVITDKYIDGVTDQIDKVTEENATLSGNTTTKKNVNLEEPTVKHRHVSNFEIPFDTFAQSENKNDNNNISDEYVPDDSALQQLVSYVYLKNHKTEENVKPLKLPTSIIPNKKATKNKIVKTKTAAKTKATTLPAKKVSSNVVNKAEPISVIHQITDQRLEFPLSQSVTTKNSGIKSKRGRPPVKSKYEKKTLQNGKLRPNRQFWFKNKP